MERSRAMRRQSGRQLVLELEHEERFRPVAPMPEALVQALADLLLETLREQEDQASTKGGVDESEDRA
jgi:hypothetical protein